MFSQKNYSPIIINKTNGSINIQSHYICSQTSLTALIELLPIVKFHEYLNYSRYKFQSGQFSFGFSFNDNSLTSINLSITKNIPSSWNETSDENLLYQKECHDELLKLWFPTGNTSFEWGSVNSILDRKTWQSCIYISYNLQANENDCK